MGIPGLLQGLKSAGLTRQGSVRDFAGQTVAVDTSSWLHKSVYSISDHYVEVMEAQGKADARSIAVSTSYVTKRCQELLRYANLRKIILVMDGRRCPLKAVTNDEREKRRKENLEEARALQRRGDKQKAFDKYKACIGIKEDLSEAVAEAVSKAFLRDGRVQIVWSPYEADAQLAKLCVDGVADCVVTEDSDVLVYQAAIRTSFPILFKLDRNSGQCDVISMDWLLSPSTESLANVGNNESSKKKVSALDQVLQAFMVRESRNPGAGARLFVQACVLSGCDYAPSELEGVGLVNAFKLIKSVIHREPEDRFRHALNQIPAKARKKLQKIEYEELLAKSEAVFFHHPVRFADGTVAFLLDPDARLDENEKLSRPNMERFQRDLSFLGELSAFEEAEKAGSSSFFPPPVPVISVKSKKSHHCDSSSASRGLPGSTRESSRAAHEIGAMTNPYEKKRKRGSGREPFAQKSPNKPSAPNQFGKFAAAMGKENDKTTFAGAMFRSVEDVRFVKRRFGEEKAPPKPRPVLPPFVPPDVFPPHRDGGRGSSISPSRNRDEPRRSGLHESPRQYPSVQSDLQQELLSLGSSRVSRMDEVQRSSTTMMQPPASIPAARYVTSFDYSECSSRNRHSVTSSSNGRLSLLEKITGSRDGNCVRRVTVDPSRDFSGVDERTSDHESLSTAGSRGILKPGPRSSKYFQQNQGLNGGPNGVQLQEAGNNFDLYDDWLDSPPKASVDLEREDDILDSPEEASFRGLASFPLQAAAPSNNFTFNTTKAKQRTLGPAKTIRNRFRGGPLARGFAKQQQMFEEERSLFGDDYVQRRSLPSSSSKSKRPNLLSYFQRKK